MFGGLQHALETAEDGQRDHRTAVVRRWVSAAEETGGIANAVALLSRMRRGFSCGWKFGVKIIDVANALERIIEIGDLPDVRPAQLSRQCRDKFHPIFSALIL